MLILHNAGQVVTVSTGGIGRKAGEAMRDVGAVERASVIIDGERIVEVQPADDVRPRAGDTVIDCTGKVILPGFVDSHTHAVFAGVRADEFAMRITGKSYQEIAEAGGGIIHSVRAVRAATLDELVALAQPRLESAMLHGTTTMEVKSGYGLDLENEIKLLEAVRVLSADSTRAIPHLHPTFLGAHAVPPEYKGRQGAYVLWVLSDLLPEVARQHLADYCDVFCDKGYFTNEETEQICTTAIALGLRIKLHCDELADTGGAALAARLGALAADHLLCVNDRGIAAMRDANVVATLLPGTAYFLGLPYAPARRIIDAGCAVALASDFNPGSSPVHNMQMIISLACTQMKMSIEEAICAATINGAAALGLGESLGSIEPGKQADCIVADVHDYREIAYWFGGNAVETVVARGKVV